MIATTMTIPEEEQEEQEEQAQRSHLARVIADQLGETEPEPCYTLRLALLLLGRKRVQALVDKALAIEESGGQLTLDGKRRRTPGGTFFFLLRKACTKEQREQLFAVDDNAGKPTRKKYSKRAAKRK